MVNLSDAFLLGYLPASQLGLYFNSAELLLANDDDGSGELAARINRQMTILHDRQPAVVAGVERIDELCTALGLQMPDPPRQPAEFHPFSQNVFTAVSDRLRDAEPAAATAHLVGFLLGDIWGTLNLTGLTLYLLAAEPEHPRLRAQAAALAREAERLLGQLTRALTHPLWDQAQRTALQNVRQTFADAPSADPAVSPAVAPAARLGALAAAIEPLSEHIAAFEAAL